ncbi:MAG: right-handed parallel beta-helix repeat-containing protein [Thermoguttaceae bacterium]
MIRADNAASPALAIHRFRNVRISGLTFRGPGQGLKIERSSGVVVQRCSFDGLSRALILGQCQDVRVESSVFSRCTLGVFCQSSVRTRLAHLTVAGASAAGILALSCGEGAIRNCLLTGNNTNLIADEISGPAWTSDHNVLEGSTGPWGSVPVIAKVYEWASASGQDRHSVHVTPAFQDPDRYDLHPAATVTWAGGLPGAQVGQVLDPKVELDRDGRPLTVRAGAVCAGAYAYPAEPKPAAGWRWLPLSLCGRGPRQSAAVYAADGTLLRTLVADAAGVHELCWDGRDDLGQPVPPGRYQVRAITHDARLVDDGAVGDNGNPLGAYNCDNADRVVSLPDGGFIVTTIYDEAGYPLRRYSASPSSLPTSRRRTMRRLPWPARTFTAWWARNPRRDWSASSCPATVRGWPMEPRIIGPLPRTRNPARSAAWRSPARRPMSPPAGSVSCACSIWPRAPARRTGLCRQLPTWPPTNRAICGRFPARTWSPWIAPGELPGATSPDWRSRSTWPQAPAVWPW